MQIIPVIDLLNGNVVRGIGGERGGYQAVKSVLSESSEPIEMVKSMLNFYPFQTLYIADLNALQNMGHSNSIIEAILIEFPDTDFWVDGGIKSVKDLEGLPDLPTLTPIIASECIEDIGRYEELRTYLGPKRYLLSLDHKSGKLGAPEIFRSPKIWPREVIVMALDDVGKGNGPDLALIQQYQSLSPTTQFMAAGGVRNEEDLNALAENRVSGLLIASALHSGKITKEHLEKIEAKKYPALRGI